MKNDLRHFRPAGYAALACILLASCSFAPSYHIPEIPSAEAYKELPPNSEVMTEAGVWAPSRPSDDKPRGAWWTVFADLELDKLEQLAFASNQNLAATAARYRQARAIADAASAAFFPDVGISSSAKRERISKNAPGNTTGKAVTQGDYVLRAQTSYELDFWGRVRNASAAAKSRAEASADDLATASLSIQSELASDYIALRGLDSQIELFETTVRAYGRALEITRNRHEGGAAAMVDVDQATTQLETAQAQLADTRLTRAQMEHAIAILVGEMPTRFTLASAPLRMTAPAIVTGLPSQLLERRPDVAAAERKMFAANAEIGIARAAWFPAFSLDAAYGFESKHSGNWLTASSQMWSVGPAMALDMLDWGRRIAQNHHAKAAYDEVVAIYRQTVIQAYGEVEDQLAALHWLDAQLEAQQRAVVSSQRSLDQANYRYKGGIVTYLEVVTAQNAALQAQQKDLTLRARRLIAAVQLIKALGGDWAAPQLDVPVQQQRSDASSTVQQVTP